MFVNSEGESIIEKTGTADALAFLMLGTFAALPPMLMYVKNRMYTPEKTLVESRSNR